MRRTQAREPSTDRSVIERVLDGDRNAYATLVERYQRRVYRTVYWMCGDPADAEELTQETFVRAYAALETQKPEHLFSTWLFQIARNQCLNLLQRRRRERRFEVGDAEDLLERAIADGSPTPLRSVEQRERLRRVWLAVAELPEDFREVLVMRHVAELSYKEICAATGLPMGTVKSRLARARHRLLAAAEADEASPERPTHGGAGEVRATRS